MLKESAVNNMKILYVAAILALLVLTGVVHAYSFGSIFIGSSNNYGSYGGYYTYPRYSYYNPSAITTLPNYYYGGSYPSWGRYNTWYGW